MAWLVGFGWGGVDWLIGCGRDGCDKAGAPGGGKGGEPIQRGKLSLLGEVSVDLHGDIDGSMAHEELGCFNVHAGVIEHGAICVAKIVGADGDGLPGVFWLFSRIKIRLFSDGLAVFLGDGAAWAASANFSEIIQEGFPSTVRRIAQHGTAVQAGTNGARGFGTLLKDGEQWGQNGHVADTRGGFGGTDGIF